MALRSEAGDLGPTPLRVAALVAAIVDGAPDGILIVDDAGRMVLANRQVEDLFGYDREELIGRSVEVLVPDEARSAHAAHRSRYGAHPAARPMGAGLQLEGRRRDGSRLPVDISLSPVEAAGRRFTVAIVRDVSDRIRAEAELRAAHRELALLEERERIARDLHDIVLQRIFATGLSLQAAALRVSDADVRGRIEEAIAELDTTIRDIRTAIFSLHRPSGSGGLRERVTAVAAEAARGLGFSPAVRFDGPVETAVGDETAEGLLAVLREALSNVARHAAAGRVDVEVEVADGLLLRVTDDGRGIPAGGEGSGGRGLANMEERARALAGSCQVSARPGGGTVVEWRIPLRPE